MALPDMIDKVHIRFGLARRKKWPAEASKVTRAYNRDIGRYTDPTGRILSKGNG